MNLEALLKRLDEVTTAITNCSTQFNVLMGHKQEVEFHISELKKEQDGVVDDRTDCPVE